MGQGPPPRMKPSKTMVSARGGTTGNGSAGSFRSPLIHTVSMSGLDKAISNARATVLRGQLDEPGQHSSSPMPKDTKTSVPSRGAVGRHTHTWPTHSRSTLQSWLVQHCSEVGTQVGRRQRPSLPQMYPGPWPVIV